MKCLSCDSVLTDFEATRKYAGSEEFVDLCNRCFNSIAEDILVVENLALSDCLDTSDDDLTPFSSGDADEDNVA